MPQRIYVTVRSRAARDEARKVDGRGSSRERKRRLLSSATMSLCTERAETLASYTAPAWEHVSARPQPASRRGALVSPLSSASLACLSTAALGMGTIEGYYNSQTL